jgi:hypothetical protein
LLFTTLAAPFAVAANNIPQVQHVIVVIQENRTPDNLFNQDTTLYNNGGHVQPTGNVGLCNIPANKTITLQGADLFTCYDTDHSHKPAWNNMWDNGGMDGACQISVDYKGLDGTVWCTNQKAPPCVLHAGNPWSQTCSYRKRAKLGGTCGGRHTDRASARGSPLSWPHSAFARPPMVCRSIECCTVSRAQMDRDRMLG